MEKANRVFTLGARDRSLENMRYRFKYLETRNRTVSDRLWYRVDRPFSKLYAKPFPPPSI